MPDANEPSIHNAWIRRRLQPPHDGRDWVQIHVFIRRNSDGVVRRLEMDALLLADDQTLSTHIWSDGNYSCDCNRIIFFREAAGESEAYDPACSEGKYTVWIQNPANGEIVYDERTPNAQVTGPR